MSPKVGELAKVWLPGETPWAECVAVHPDGSWEGRIANRLFAEMTDEERAGTLAGMGWGGREALPRLHAYRQDQVVRFAAADEGTWQPAERAGGHA